MLGEHPGSVFDSREAGRTDIDWYLGSHSLRGGLDAEANVSDSRKIFREGCSISITSHQSPRTSIHMKC